MGPFNCGRIHRYPSKTNMIHGTNKESYDPLIFDTDIYIYMYIYIYVCNVYILYILYVN